MAPLPAAAAAPAPPVPKGASTGTAPPAQDAPFARLLGAGDGAAVTAGPAAAVEAAPGDAMAGPSDLRFDALDPAAEDVVSSMAGAPLAPAPDAPWPPTGLGGLFMAGAGVPPTPDALASDRPVGSGTGAAQALPDAGAARSLLHRATGVPGAAPSDAASAAPVATLADAAFAAAAGSTDVDAMAAAGAPPSSIDAAEPSPAAFTLPQAPAPVAREPAPVLAAPGATPDVRGGDFGERFGAQLQWMAGQNIGHARIQVTPHDLGPVEVLLRMDGDSISADFISAHAETRQALEHGLPRLRDLLGEHGFQLAHAGVGSDGPASQDEGHAAAGAGRPGQAGTVDSAGGDGAPAPARTLRGLVDAYA